MKDAIRELAERAIAERVFPGCVVGFVRATDEREILPFGQTRYDCGEPVSETTVYDVASVTKSIPTAALAAQFVHEGKLALADKVTKYVPELHNDYGATIEDLLRYRVRGPRLSTLRYETFEEVHAHVLEHGFDGPPGESEYTNLPAYILGIILERVGLPAQAGGASLAGLAHTHFFEPLDMRDTTYFPNADDCAPTEIIEGDEIRGVPHDESTRLFALSRRTVGHAGLFSTAPDMLTFLDALLQGKYPHVVEWAEKGLGWAVNELFFMGNPRGDAPRIGTGQCARRVACCGKTGFTGCSVLCDRARGVGLVILSNRTYPKRPADATSLNSAINIFRRNIADIVLS
jgi:CubicO group peptidase (beta-lactamase class C family)